MLPVYTQQHALFILLCFVLSSFHMQHQHEEALEASHPGMLASAKAGTLTGSCLTAVTYFLMLPVTLHA